MAICVVCKTNKLSIFSSYFAYFEDDYYEVCSPECVATAEANYQAPERPKLSDFSPDDLVSEPSKYHLWAKEHASQISDLKLFGIKLIMAMIVVGIGFASLEVQSTCNGDLNDPTYSTYDWDGYCTSSVGFNREIRRLFY
ncbi:hypothetical protein OAV86_03040 [Pseudomonadales bacterium]|nr:hypothetical protein [Pseudomonadales bacterium]